MIVGRINEYGNVPLRISVTSRNGDRLVSPSNVIVQLTTANAYSRDIQATVTLCGEDLLDCLKEISIELALRDPVAEFRGRAHQTRHARLTTICEPPPSSWMA
jgi:hypothetical protein